MGKAASGGIRQRCRTDCPARCRTHRWEWSLELPPDASGKRRAVSKGGYLTRRAAVEARETAVAQHRAGVLPTTTDRRVLVGDYLASWLRAKRESLEPTTWRSYEAHIRVHLDPSLGGLRLVDVRAGHLEAMFERIAAAATAAGRTPMGPATRRRVLATWRSAVGDAVRRGQLTHDHSKHVILARGERPRVRPWTPEAYWTFIGWCERQPPASSAARLLPLVLTTAATGLRLGEVCAVRWADIDLERATLTVVEAAQQIGTVIRYTQPKSRAGEGRTVPLTRAAVDVLRRHRAAQGRERLEWGEGWVDSGRVFCSPGGAALVPSSVSRGFSRLVTASGAPRTRFHDLRHLALTVMLQGGVPMVAVSRIAGHSAISVTVDTYGHVSVDDAVRAAVEQAFRASTPRSRSVP